MMMSLPGTPNIDAAYAVSRLQATPHYGMADDDIDGLLHRLQTQEEADRRAGFDYVSTICRAMKDGLAETHSGARPPPAD